METNTIAGVNLAAVAEETLPHLSQVFGPLNGIITDLSSDVAATGASVVTRIPTTPTAVDLASGYTSQNTTLTAKTVTLDTFYGYVWGFKDSERSKSAVALNDLFIQPALTALGTKVFGDIWNLVTASAFTANASITAANFDRDDLADLGTVLTATCSAPKWGRTAWLKPSYYAGVLKSMNDAEFPGQTTDKAEGVAVRTSGFDIYEQSGADANSEFLAGLAFHRSALCIAARRVDAEGAMEAGVEVQDILVPGLNLPVQFRRWYSPNDGELKYSVGLLYGAAVGTAMGVRIVEL